MELHQLYGVYRAGDEWTGSPPVNGGIVYDHPRNVPQAVGRITFGPRVDDDRLARRHVEGDNDNLPAAQQPAGIALHYESAAQDRGPYITTFTGRFHPFDPRPQDFKIEDIIHSLAGMVRYTSHGKRRYVVAEHSVHICRWLRAQGEDSETQLSGLLHDAPEAVSGFGDVARPAKKRAPIIKETEDAIWRRAIAPKFDLPLDIPEVVHEADSRICADEMAQNLHEVDPNVGPPLGITLEFWEPARAASEFWREFYRLQCERQQEARQAMCAIEARHDREASRADWEYQFRKEQEAA